MCDDGVTGVKWIETAFGECVVNSRDKWSFGVGMVSNFMWIISSVPQVYQNCVVKRVDGQSPALFTLMVIGNILSLIGVIITDGLVTQIITSALYVILDGVMFVQFWWYGYIKPCVMKRRKSEKVGGDDDQLNISSSEEKPSEDDKPVHVQEIDGVPVAGLAAAALVQTASATNWAAPY